jgi:hypothetical protein
MMMETSGFLSISYFLRFVAFGWMGMTTLCTANVSTLQASMGDITAVLHSIEADALDGFVGARDGGLQGEGAGRDSEDASASGHNLAIDEAGASVKHPHAIECISTLQSSDGLA